MESSREINMSSGTPNTISTEESSMKKHQVEDKNTVAGTFLKCSVLGLGFGLVFGGFAFGLGRARKSSDFSMVPIKGHESPSRLGLRALGWGTLIAVTSVCSPVLAIAYYSGASNVSLCSLINSETCIILRLNLCSISPEFPSRRPLFLFKAHFKFPYGTILGHCILSRFHCNTYFTIKFTFIIEMFLFIYSLKNSETKSETY